MMRAKPSKTLAHIVFLLLLGLAVRCAHVSSEEEGQTLTSLNDPLESNPTKLQDTLLFPMIDTVWNTHSLRLDWYQLSPEERGGIKISIEENVLYFESSFDDAFVSMDHKGLLVKEHSGWRLSQLFFVNSETFIFSVRNIGMSRAVVYLVNYKEGVISLNGKDVGGQCYYIAYLPKEKKLMWHSSADYIEEGEETIRTRSLWELTVSDSGFVNKEYTRHTQSDVAETDSCLYPNCWEEQYRLYYSEALKFLEKK